jgi:hypothetical protein
MGEWDAGHVFAVPQGLRAPGGNARGGALSNNDVEEATKRFIRDFRVGTIYIYRERLLNNAQQGRYHLEIDLEHLKNFSEELHDVITKQPAQYLENVSLRAHGCAHPLPPSPPLPCSPMPCTHTHACRWSGARATF